MEDDLCARLLKRIFSMIDYDLPYGLCKMDSVAGVVSRASRFGCEVALEVEGVEGKIPSAFVHCAGEIGQRVLVSLMYFSKKHGNFIAKIDGYLDEDGVSPCRQPVRLLAVEEGQCVLNVA